MSAEPRRDTLPSASWPSDAGPASAPRARESSPGAYSEIRPRVVEARITPAEAQIIWEAHLELSQAYTRRALARHAGGSR